MTGTEVIIFVVDDDASVCRALERTLRAAGYERVETFVSPGAFLSRFRPDERCLLILDLVMPAMNGVEVRQRLEKRGCFVPTVFISAHPRELERAASMPAEGSAFVPKPFDGDELLAAVSRLLGS